MGSTEQQVCKMETTMYARRGSLLPRPRAPSYSSDQEKLLPRNSSCTYTISSRQSSCTSIPPRPIPPTPRRMMSAPRAPPTTRVKHRRRQSGIPRPASGSSRRVISSQSTVTSSEGLPNKRVSFMGKESQPPSSWRTPQKSVQVDSLVPYSQRKPDLSGKKHQLQIRHHSTQSLSSPSQIGSPRQLPNNDLPKSPNTVSLMLSPSRDVTPRRRLMKPLSPPLPKIHSTTSVSCFNASFNTPSPAKNDNPSFPRTSIPRVSKVDVVGALLESRMTNEEIQLFNQAQKEAATNQHRLRDSLSARQHNQKSPTASDTPSTSFTRNSGAATVTLSVNDIANTRRLEQQTNSASSSRPLFINSSLANASNSGSDLPTPNTIGSAVSFGPDDDWEVNLKLVCEQTGGPSQTNRARYILLNHLHTGLVDI